MHWSYTIKDENLETVREYELSEINYKNLPHNQPSMGNAFQPSAGYYQHSCGQEQVCIIQEQYTPVKTILIRPVSKADRANRTKQLTSQKSFAAVNNRSGLRMDGRE